MVWAELKLMQTSGFLPSFDQCAVTGALLKEGSPVASPDAGGYVRASEAANYTDRFRCKPEALLGLAKTALLDEPPSNLKFAEECLAALMPFWRHIAATRLPANEAKVHEIQHKRATGEKLD